jgi:hypothetical protein
MRGIIGRGSFEAAVLSGVLTMDLFSALRVYHLRYFAPNTITHWHAKENGNGITP